MYVRDRSRFSVGVGYETTFASKVCWTYSVVSIKRTGSLNYFEFFYHPKLFFHVLNEIFLPP